MTINGSYSKAYSRNKISVEIYMHGVFLHKKDTIEWSMGLCIVAKEFKNA